MVVSMAVTKGFCNAIRDTKEEKRLFTLFRLKLKQLEVVFQNDIEKLFAIEHSIFVNTKFNIC